MYSNVLTHLLHHKEAIQLINNFREYRQLTTRPGPFELNHDDEFQSLDETQEERATRVWEQGDWFDFLEKNGSQLSVSHGKFKCPMIEQMKSWNDLYANGYCTKCGTRSHECHTMKYGPLCMEAVSAYNRASHHFGNDINAARHFINYYNMALEIDAFKDTGTLTMIGWKFPPPCMKERCLDFVVQWISWINVGRFTLSGDEAPKEFYEFAGEEVPEDLLQENEVKMTSKNERKRRKEGNAK